MHLLEFVVLLLIAQSVERGKSQEAPWNYDPDSPYGPDNWKDYYPYCGGQSQSPIDVITADVQLDDTLTDFTYINYDNSESGTFVLLNSGHDITVNILDSEIYLSGGGLQWNYNLAQFHFHWGRDDTEGSEHLVDGAKATVELHIVHWNSDLYSSFEEAAPSPNGLAVIGVFIEIGDDESDLNEELSQLTTYFDQIIYPGNETVVPTFPVLALLPPGRSYYRYNGGMTTPACWETAVGTVFKDPIYITSSEAARFRITYDLYGDLLDYNIRPVQALNGRTVYTNAL